MKRPPLIKVKFAMEPVEDVRQYALHLEARLREMEQAAERLSGGLEQLADAVYAWIVVIDGEAEDTRTALDEARGRAEKALAAYREAQK